MIVTIVVVNVHQEKIIQFANVLKNVALQKTILALIQQETQEKLRNLGMRNKTVMNANVDAN